MPVCHMVWLKFRDDARDDQVDGLLADAAQLAGKIPGLVSICAGRNFTDRAEGYNAGLLAILKDKSALPVYAQHPAHEAYAARLRELASAVKALDFEY